MIRHVDEDLVVTANNTSDIDTANYIQIETPMFELSSTYNSRSNKEKLKILTDIQNFVWEKLGELVE